ncbi:GNAT family N-acetyltransferase [Cohnella thermotolerans]|uniref:GNAT family N-acetyltransferase n=1 Tax=Cohnella thermotolerans TaxID=329858 RepID=UPI000410EBA8|nr:GNAT family N-acetyltransferase [Cohnella thermotolerans]
MEFITFDRPDDRYWPAALRLYHEAFPNGKPDRIIANSFAKGVGYGHVAVEGGEVVAMAFTGLLRQANALLIDYIAVRKAERRRGWGARLVDEIKRQARAMGLDGLILEAEAGPEPENLGRIRFWERCGFTLTPYVHQYIWVPEPYRAMYLSFDPNKPLPADGRELFRHIGAFHSLVFRSGKPKA